MGEEELFELEEAKENGTTFFFVFVVVACFFSLGAGSISSRAFVAPTFSSPSPSSSAFTPAATFPKKTAEQSTPA